MQNWIWDLDGAAFVNPSNQIPNRATEVEEKKKISRLFVITHARTYACDERSLGSFLQILSRN